MWLAGWLAGVAVFDRLIIGWLGWVGQVSDACDLVTGFVSCGDGAHPDSIHRRKSREVFAREECRFLPKQAVDVWLPQLLMD